MVPRFSSHFTRYFRLKIRFCKEPILVLIGQRGKFWLQFLAATKPIGTKVDDDNRVIEESFVEIIVPL